MHFGFDTASLIFVRGVASVTFFCNRGVSVATSAKLAIRFGVKIRIWIGSKLKIPRASVSGCSNETFFYLNTIYANCCYA